MRRRGRPPHPDVLTPREWEVLSLLRDGRSNPEIAAELGVTRDAVKYHVSQILAKLGVSSREEAAVWAREPVAAGDDGWRSALGAMLARLPTAGRIGLIGTAGVALAGLAVLAGAVAYNELRENDDSATASGGGPLGRVAFVRDGDLWEADLDGGAETMSVEAESLDFGEEPLPELFAKPPFVPAISRPGWSADGNWLSFGVLRNMPANYGVDQLYSLFVVRPDGTALYSPWNADAYAYAEQIGVRGVANWDWSPVGAQLADAEWIAPAGMYHMSVTNPTGEHSGWNEHLSYNPQSGFVWAPDGEHIAGVLGIQADIFGMHGERYDLALLDASDSTDYYPIERDGTINVIEEFPGPRPIPRLHSIAPDSEQILLWEVTTTPPVVHRLSSLALDGSGHKSHIADVYVADWAAAWSPDSTAIAAIQGGEPDGWRGRRLIVATPDGARLLDLSSETMSDSHPAWSPDGTQIGFVRAPERPDDAGLGEGHIWMTSPEGPPVQITDDPAYTERYPQWSPDGAAILFVRLPADAATRETVTPELWAMSLDGANQRKVLELDEMSGEQALLKDDWDWVFDWYPAGSAAPGATVPEPATPTPNVPPITPTPTTPTDSAQPQATELTYGDEVALPDGVAVLIETGCPRGCEQTYGILHRVFKAPDGTFVNEPLLTVRDGVFDAAGSRIDDHPARYILSTLVSPMGSEIVVVVCAEGRCLLDENREPNSVSRAYRSVDGGITWSEYFTASGIDGFMDLARGGVLVDIGYKTYDPNYHILPSGETLEPPFHGGTRILDDGTPVYYSFEFDGIYYRQDGSTAFVLPSLPDYGAIAQELSGDLESGVIATWSSARLFIGEFERQPPSEFLDLSWRVTHGRLRGNPRRLPGERLFLASADLSELYGDVGLPWVPVVIDANRATIHPIAAPFLDSAFPREITQGIHLGVQTGPFARVVNTDSCLNIRDGPAPDAAVRACVADGVLLTIERPISEGWIPVRSPAGVDGWASADYLEYSEFDVHARVQVVSSDRCAEVLTEPVFGEVLECVPDGAVLEPNGREWAEMDGCMWIAVLTTDGHPGWITGALVRNPPLGSVPGVTLSDCREGPAP